MQWFEELKAALPEYYRGGDADVVAYYRGPSGAGSWRHMQTRSAGQMVILGNRPPHREEWVAAGVAQRGGDVILRIGNLSGFIIVYGGFMYRPWGHIVTVGDTTDAWFQRSLVSWRNNYMKPKTWT